jgi:putative hydrolase of the HAD superfamily
MSDTPTTLIVDWGGVLTGDMRTLVRKWTDADGIDLDSYSAAMRDWLGDAAGLEARFNPVHALERGEISVPDFQTHLAEALSARTGVAIEADGLLERMFRHFEHAADMTGLVRRAHSAGITTALLSNSWGNEYPRDGWADMFDVVVISGEVGMRKPERRIFEHTLNLLDRAPSECVFVDDLRHNITAAVEVGMIGILHTSYEMTATEIDTLFGMHLSS